MVGFSKDVLNPVTQDCTLVIGTRFLIAVHWLGVVQGVFVEALEQGGKS